MRARIFASIVLSLLTGAPASVSIAAPADEASPYTIQPGRHDWDGAYFGALFMLSSIKQKYTDATGLRGSLSGSGKLAAFIAGYNHRKDERVFGAEFDIGSGKMFSSRIAYMANFRGRFGIADKASLSYISGGISLVAVKSPFNVSNHKLQSGFTLGAGYERLLANAITGRLEFVHGRYFRPSNPGANRVRVKSMNMLRAAVTIHFNH